MAVSELYLGAAIAETVSKVYLGETLIFERASLPPPIMGNNNPSKGTIRLRVEPFIDLTWYTGGQLRLWIEYRNNGGSWIFTDFGGGTPSEGFLFIPSEFPAITDPIGTVSGTIEGRARYEYPDGSGNFSDYGSTGEIIT